MSRWRFWAVFFAQNTTLIIISHVIKIITKGFMHNTDYFNVSKWFGTDAPIPFCPIRNVVTTVSVVTT